jgi:hypothetical protein
MVVERRAESPACDCIAAISSPLRRRRWARTSRNEIEPVLLKDHLELGRAPRNFRPSSMPA